MNESGKLDEDPMRDIIKVDDYLKKEDVLGTLKETETASTTELGCSTLKAVIEFTTKQSAILRRDQKVQVTARRFGNLSIPVVCRIKTIDGTAEAQKDYIPINETLTFAADEVIKSLDIAIIDDNAWEPDAVFFLKLSLDPDHDISQLAVVGKRAIQEITILNDDGGEVNLSTLAQLIGHKVTNPPSECPESRMYDKEGCGIITVKEMCHLVTRVGDKLSDEEADDNVGCDKTAEKARITQLQSRLSEQATQIADIETEKKSLERALSATELKLEKAVAETRRLKEELKESKELNGTMTMELRMQKMLTKTENKTNKEVSASRQSGCPSGDQLSLLLMEIRPMRLKMQKLLETNSALRLQLEQMSINPLPAQPTATNMTDTMGNGEDVGNLIDSLLRECRQASSRLDEIPTMLAATEDTRKVVLKRFHAESDSTVSTYKTPIRQLQELGSERGFTPTYKLLAKLGHHRDTCFVFRVVAEGCMAEGKGISKQKAKHAAAAELLSILPPLNTLPPSKKRKIGREFGNVA